MAHIASRSILLTLVFGLALAGCDDGDFALPDQGGVGHVDGAVHHDLGVADQWVVADLFLGDGSRPDAGAVDQGAAPADAYIPPNLSRALKWTRQNPMPISALTPHVVMPHAQAVQDYFGRFQANAAHLWQTGLPDEVDAWQTHAGKTMPWISWVDFDGKSSRNKQIIGGVGANPPGRIGYQIGDEPLDKASVDRMIAGSLAVRQADPEAMIIFNYTYSLDNLEQEIERCATTGEVDVLSYDAYTHSNGAYEHLERYRRIGLKHNKAYWRWLYSYKKDAGDTYDKTDVLWDAMSGLLYGFTGHSWFLYQVGPGTPLLPALFANAGGYDQPKTALYDIVAAVNVKLRNLGRAVTQMTSTATHYNAAIDLGPLTQPKHTTRWAPGAGGDSFLRTIVGGDFSVGLFIDDFGERYVMLQNVKHKNGTTPLDWGVGPVTFELTFDFTGSNVDASKVLVLDGLTGQVKDHALTSLGGQAAKLTATVPAGDVIFFKYATGRSFALGPAS